MRFVRLRQRLLTTLLQISWTDCAKAPGRIPAPMAPRLDDHGFAERSHLRACIHCSPNAVLK